MVDATAAVLGRERNVLISGGTGSGKTTLLNALVSLLPAEGRVISIEDALEQRLRRANCLRFEVRRLGDRGVTIRDFGDTLHDANGTRVAIVNAFTTVNPETEVTVRAVDYQVVGARAPDQFRVYSDDERDVARWRRVETPE